MFVLRGLFVFSLRPYVMSPSCSMDRCRIAGRRGVGSSVSCIPTKYSHSGFTYSQLALQGCLLPPVSSKHSDDMMTILYHPQHLVRLKLPWLSWSKARCLANC